VFSGLLNKFRRYNWKKFDNKTKSNSFRPRSRGTIRLSSTNPFDQPIIDPNIFSNPYDFEAMIDGLKKSFKIASNGLFSKLARLYSKPIPGCQMCSNGQTYDCDSYLRCYVRQMTSSFHVAGSVRMGSANHSSSVVDERMRVINISGLRVIDGSVMPVIVNANTMAAIIMIGEKGAQFVRDDNQ